MIKLREGLVSDELIKDASFGELAIRHSNLPSPVPHTMHSSKLFSEPEEFKWAAGEYDGGFMEWSSKDVLYLESGPPRGIWLDCEWHVFSDEQRASFKHIKRDDWHTHAKNLVIHSSVKPDEPQKRQSASGDGFQLIVLPDGVEPACGWAGWETNLWDRTRRQGLMNGPD